MGEYAAIPTVYNGYKFRSRLEARWAVFFDDAGIEYQYEPEGFVLTYGMRYLPDFALFNIRWRGEDSKYTGKPGKPIYVEVKGANEYKDISIEDRVRMEEFAKKYPLLVLGNIPANAKEAAYNSDAICNYWLLDGDWYPCFFSWFDNEIWLCGPDHDEAAGYTYMDRSLVKARLARFEHGETPKPREEDASNNRNSLFSDYEIPF